jgi:hypothetical protein
MVSILHSQTLTLNTLTFIMNSEIVRSMDKVVRLGKTKIGESLKVDVFCKIKVENGKLSITGVVGPKSNGDCHGSCGQIVMHVPDITNLAQGWDQDTISKFFAVWHRWHLNDMRAGSQVQENWLREHPITESEYAYPKSHYEVASAKLAEVGLNPDKDGYLYGHAWKNEELPDDVIDFLASLSNTDIQPAWV